jgi:hypothetical protein
LLVSVQRFCVLSSVGVCASQARERIGYEGMLRAQSAKADAEGIFKERSRLNKTVCPAKGQSEVVFRCCNPNVATAKVVDTQFLQYRRSVVISNENLKIFDIELSYRTRYRSSFSYLRYRRLHLRYRNIKVSNVRPSILKVGKVPDGMALLYICQWNPQTCYILGICQAYAMTSCALCLTYARAWHMPGI